MAITAAAGSKTGASTLALYSVDDRRLICARVHTARSFWERLVGLIGRTQLDQDEALLLSGNSVHMLFMRFPIDCLFLGPRAADGTQRVVGLRAALQPWTGIGWQWGAREVVELPAGTLARGDLQAGDVVRLEAVAAGGQ
jgi:uncharacterized protein